MYPINVHPDVYDELEFARKWYTDKSIALGNEFLDEIDFAVKFHRKKRWLGLYGYKPCKARSHSCGFTRHCAPRVEPGISL